MTMSEERECLKYRLKGHLSTEELDLWGHEYVRHLSGEVVQEFNSLPEEAGSYSLFCFERNNLLVKK
jgi:26S proteasome regulatory subunit N1